MVREDDVGFRVAASRAGLEEPSSEPGVEVAHHDFTSPRGACPPDAWSFLLPVSVSACFPQTVS